MSDNAPKTSGEVEKALAELRAQAKEPGYREKSLKIHGHICARCAREFSGKNLKLLTVHHRDSNPRNNPEDGSNWENLCVYCHDEEHSRELLGDYEEGRSKPAKGEVKGLGEGTKMGSLGDLFKNARLKK
ncbi:HNH nuclease family protein [bacterium]|nr:MAG: HNH nuclease family protein [bacterium]